MALSDQGTTQARGANIDDRYKNEAKNVLGMQMALYNLYHAIDNVIHLFAESCSFHCSLNDQDDSREYVNLMRDK